MSLHLGLALNQELSLTGRLMDADECRRVGVLNRIAPGESLLAEASALARELAARPPIALRRTKQRFRQLTQAAFDDAGRAAVEGQLECYRAGEPQAVMARFIAERDARRKA
jgi:enoyl-CoA hydratase/carnithine racemase